MAVLKCAFIGDMAEDMLEWVKESIESRDEKDAELFMSMKRRKEIEEQLRRTWDPKTVFLF